ncbi:hypothetical protein KBD45_03985 [Candidatus Dojkabacteria bacterium]|nr:hypothetical protein [Candidatus Dojkabacteria bacterium]
MELILSIAILAILTSSIIVVLAYVNKVTSVKGKKLDAVNYAQEGVEAILSIKEEDFASLDPGAETKFYHLEVASDLWDLVEYPDENVPVENGLQRVITVQRVLFEGDPPTARILKVKVEVKWTQLEGAGNSIFIEKLISNWSKNLNAVNIQTDWCQSNFDSLSEVDIIGEQKARKISVNSDDVVVSTGMDLAAGSKTFAKFVQGQTTLSAPLYSAGYISKAIFNLNEKVYVATDSNKEEIVIYDVSETIQKEGIDAIGGIISDYTGDGTNGLLGVRYRTHKFTTVGNSTFNVTSAPENSKVEVLVVAGGGGGGMDMGGGGGGGGVLYNAAYPITNQPITVTVGAGGNGGPAAGTFGQPSSHQYTIPATKGQDSVFGSITAIGGGFGGSSYRNYTPGIAGGNGGSGGGASGYNDSTVMYNGGTGTAGQGFAGGYSNATYYSGGGGGAGGSGANSPSKPNGGPGVLNNILGVNYYWGGGGGGASYTMATGGDGGIGGGGGGAVGVTIGGVGLNSGSPGGGGSPVSQTNRPGGDGGANTGGGGGGGSHYNSNNKGGNGGSGIVVVRYVISEIDNSQPIENIVASGGVVTDSTGTDGIKYRTHKFSSAGTDTFNVSSAPANSKIEVYAWGGGGAGGTVGGWVYGAAGGAGGAARGTVDIVSGKSYAVVVGGGGGVNSYSAGALTCVPGGGACASWNNTGNTYGSGGGGYSGLFDTTVSQTNALILAGGGGGGASSRAGTGNVGGAGGGSIGEDGSSPYDSKTGYRGRGGSQTAAGIDASCDSANTTGGQGALQGGRSKVNSYGGAGGGGYWGGSGGGYSESNTMGGGGGGSGYYNPTYVSSAILTAGTGTTPGDSANTLRGTAGNAGGVATAGTAGTVIIRYPINTDTRGFSKVGFFNASGCDCKSPIDISVKSAAGTTTGYMLMEDSLVSFDATTPSLEESLPQLDQFSLPYIAKSFYIRGNYAFIGFEDNFENILLKVLDVSDPTNIQEVTGGEVVTLSSSITEIRDVFANADSSRVYLLTNNMDGVGEAEFIVLDSSNKAAMTVIDSYDTTGTSDFEPSVFSFVTNDIAVIGGSVSDPATMPILQIVEGLTLDDPISCNSIADSSYDSIYDIESKIGTYAGNTVTYLYLTTNDTKELKVLRGQYDGVSSNEDPNQKQIIRF